MGKRTISSQLSGFGGEEVASVGYFTLGNWPRIKPIELEFQSKSPVSQGVARSGTAEWHPYRSSIRISATNAEPRTSWLLPSSTSRERAHIRGHFIPGQANLILRRQSLHLLPRGYLAPLSSSGGRWFSSCPCGPLSDSGRFSKLPKATYASGGSSSFCFCFLLWLLWLAWSSISGRWPDYNREVYPRLRWNWEHTYICRRCGKPRLIPSSLRALVRH